MTTRPRTLLATCLLSISALLAGCGSAATSGDPDSAHDRSAQAAGYPRTIENCGRTVTVDGPPRRAVSLDQSSTEILLSLGLADRMAGTAMWTDPVREELARANAGVPRLADRLPSYESVLAAEPDFVSASFLYTYETVRSRADFAELGVPAYLSPADCVGKSNDGDGNGARTQPLRMRAIYDEIRDLAAVFGVEQRGAELIDSLQQRVQRAAASTDAADVSMLYWFNNSDSPSVAGCCGAPGIITRALGTENVFGDTMQEWPQAGWEGVAGRDPDVLVLGNLTRQAQSVESAASKIRFLKAHPVTRHMDAVRNDRFILLSGAAMNPSIRTVDGIEHVAAELRRMGLAG